MVFEIFGYVVVLYLFVDSDVDMFDLVCNYLQKNGVEIEVEVLFEFVGGFFGYCSFVNVEMEKFVVFVYGFGCLVIVIDVCVLCEINVDENVCCVVFLVFNGDVQLV